MATATSSPPAPMPSMPMPPAGRRMAVGADERLSGDAEALKMDLMADSVSGAREVNAVLFGHRLDKAVVVGVFKAGLQGVVVDIGDGTLCFDAVYAHRLKFQIRHRAGGVLRQRLIDPEPNLRAGLHFS